MTNTNDASSRPAAAAEPREAGKQLDAEVARVVFGHKVINPDLLADFVRPDEVQSVWRIEFTETGYRGVQVPHYSTDIGAAYLVLAKVLTMPQPAPWRFYESLRVQMIGVPANVLGDWLLAHDRHPEMLCRAALTALRAAAGERGAGEAE